MRIKAKDNLNKKEYNLYILIKNYIEKYNYSPSYRELTELSEYKSLSTIAETLMKFERLGYIETAKDEKGKIKSRTIRIVDTEEVKERIEREKDILYNFRKWYE